MRALVVLFALLSTPAWGATVVSTERQLSVAGAFVEDGGPGVRYWAVGLESGRFDDDPRALRQEGSRVQFSSPGALIVCIPTAATVRTTQTGRVSERSVPGTSGTTRWQTRTLTGLVCAVTTPTQSFQAPGTYVARRLTLTGDAP